MQWHKKSGMEADYVTLTSNSAIWNLTTAESAPVAQRLTSSANQKLIGQSDKAAALVLLGVRAFAIYSASRNTFVC